jgi:glutamate formiminotransferase/formiminotetrahydrofolate cyclodeaminase
MIEKGNPNSLSDAGVAALMARSCATGAFYNVLINLQGLEDESFCSQVKQEALALYDQASAKADELHRTMLAKL